MKIEMDRRLFLAASGTLAAAAAFPAFAQDKPVLRFSAVFSERDIRAEMMNMFAEAVKDDFTYQGDNGDSLFRQGTELLAIQRGLLDMGNIAPQDISTHIPAWSIVTAGYLFRDAAHMSAFLASDVSAGLKQLAEDQLGVRILGPTYYGMRQLGLKGDKEIRTPADLAGVKLRMPGGAAWQFLGSALGANPTPMDFIHVHGGLQSGTIDGQDNPLPNVENMKFYEVIDQIVLTSHLVGFDLLIISKQVWDGMDADKQAKFQAAVDRAIDFSTEKHLSREKELVDHFEAKGLKIYEPDVAAFRKHVQEQYLASSLSKDWPAGLVDKINAM
jgi:TRAP-type C4-dicarboxylate transport system substrate-binding protein